MERTTRNSRAYCTDLPLSRWHATVVGDLSSLAPAHFVKTIADSSLYLEASLRGTAQLPALHLAGKPVACNLGLVSVSRELLWGIITIYHGLVFSELWAKLGCSNQLFWAFSELWATLK